MAASGTYGRQTLNDNWYEDRHQSADALTATGGFSKRKAREYEPGIAYIGERYDVLARVSRMPPRETYAMPDDGFREMDKTSLVDFAHPKTRKEYVPAKLKPRLVTPESVLEVSYEDRRPVVGEKSGFGAVLNRHEATHDQRFFNTTHGDVYGFSMDGYSTKVRGAPKRCNSTLGPAGVSSEADEGRVQGVKVGSLCGEKYVLSDDPASDTATQRAWLYQSDPSLANVHLGGTRPRPGRYDNELSLPIGEGAMGKVRSDLRERQGRLYKTATHITKGLGHRSGINIFQDG